MRKTEMGRFNISPDEDSSSYSSNSDFNYSYPTKQAALKSHYVDVDPENQNFLLESNLGKKKYETDFHPGTTSFGMSVFNLSNAIVGSGILGLSYAMANTGIALFILWYLNGDYLVLLVSLLLILPLSLLRNLGYLGYTSGLSLLCMMFFLIVVICKKFQIPCPEALMVNETVNATSALALLASNVTLNATTTADCCRPRYFIFNSQTVYAVPILTFSFVCHPAVLPIYEELKGRSRRRMMNVSKISFFAMFLMYLLAALFGYLTFYGQVESELLHTYSKVVGTDILLLVVRLAVLMAVTLTVPVVIFPIRSSITHLLCAAKEFSWWRHSVITVAILAFTNLLVIFVPTIRDIFGFIGASAAAMLIFILPSAFYIKLVKKESLRSVQKIGALLFLVSGIVVMFGSIALIVLDWVHNASTGQAGNPSRDTGEAEQSLGDVIQLPKYNRQGFSVCIPDYPRIHSVEQSGLALTEIHLPLSPECWG
ncbi:sodium-coupled neutral amino acid transporter 2 [Cricetulus griseus]|uniref:Sodium-coupled neutral amino acid symporter 2 n=1 Tax=Cricetulus griseus TaxID=10029 RepID=A0A061IF91_CRIGR|nr:sodium-coupled neutral amino acid transporter 2 [Cricetulus griseus]